MKNYIKTISKINRKIHSDNCRQLKLLNENDFIRLLTDYKVVSVDKKQLTNLWYLGFLCADIVESSKPIKQKGLDLVGEDEGVFTYSDCRELQSKAKGYLDSFQGIVAYDFEVKLFFHPFRSYVLWHLQKNLKFSPSAFQILQYQDGFPKITDYHVQIRKDLTSGKNWSDCVNKWNNIVSLCVVSEPACHNTIFSKIVFNGEFCRKKLLDRLQSLTEEVDQLYSQLDESKGIQLYGEICKDAEFVDANKDLHLIIRLMSASERLKLKGSIALSVCFLTMAECVRRCLEAAFDKLYPEEDECGFGVVFRDAKIILQGDTRVLDGNRVVANQFLRRFGLDYGIRLNIYVEGDTEYEVLAAEFAGNSSVLVINLRGSFVEKNGKGVSFRESLRNDIKAKTFSVILFDEDVEDNLRVVKQAAKNDEICGMFFVSKPDFELENFSLSELAEIFYELAIKDEETDFSLQEIQKTISGATVDSGKSFFKTIRGNYPQISRIGKGKEWGDVLRKYARKNKKGAKFGDEQDRLINRVIWIGYQCCSIPYEYTRQKKKVDPTTGELVDR